MAKSFEWNSDFTELTVTLRKGHKWSDGAPFTTEDILFWWEDIMTNTELFQSVPSYWVYGGEPMQVEAVDDVTVKFKFAAPAPAFTTLLATTFTHLWAPKHYLKDMHLTYNPNADEEAKAEGSTLGRRASSPCTSASGRIRTTFWASLTWKPGSKSKRPPSTSSLRPIPTTTRWIPPDSSCRTSTRSRSNMRLRTRSSS